MQRDIFRRDRKCPLEPCGCAVGIPECLLNERDLAQRREVVRRTIEQIAKGDCRIGRPTKSRVPFAKCQRHCAVARGLAQLFHEQLHAFPVDARAGGELLQILCGQCHARIDIERTLEAGRRFMRQAMPCEHHSAVVLRTGVGCRYATCDRAQPIRFTDRHDGHRLRGD